MTGRLACNQIGQTGFYLMMSGAAELEARSSGVTRSGELAIERKWLLWSRVDPEAFVHFCEKYYDKIFSFILRKVGDEDIAKDLTQETFNIALHRLWQFRFQGVTIGGWFYRIALSQVSRTHPAPGSQVPPAGHRASSPAWAQTPSVQESAVQETPSSQSSSLRVHRSTTCSMRPRAS